MRKILVAAARTRQLFEEAGFSARDKTSNAKRRLRLTSQS
jgi:hypothetical protein